MLESALKPERRRWERIPIPVPVFVRGVDHEQRTFLEFATITNINFGGALLITRRYLSVGTIVEIEVPCATGQAFPFGRVLQARLVHTAWMECSHAAGLKFIEPLTIRKSVCSLTTEHFA